MFQTGSLLPHYFCTEFGMFEDALGTIPPAIILAITSAIILPFIVLAIRALTIIVLAIIALDIIADDIV